MNCFFCSMKKDKIQPCTLPLSQLFFFYISSTVVSSSHTSLYIFLQFLFCLSKKKKKGKPGTEMTLSRLLGINEASTKVG